KTARHFLGDRLRSADGTSLADLGTGEGKLLRLDGDLVAAYRDEGGTVHAVSPVCTHLGCIVRFNAAERSWDCPCHGSRYDVDGAVLQGPTTPPPAPKAVDTAPTGWSVRRPVLGGVRSRARREHDQARPPGRGAPGRATAAR